MYSCMLNMRLRHITLLANDILLWNNLTTVHSVYNYANMYTYILAIDSICNLHYIRLEWKMHKRKHTVNQKTQQQTQATTADSWIFYVQ